MRRTPSSTSRRLVLALAVMCLALLVFPSVAHAADPPPASISGTVLDGTTGVHLPRMTVTLYYFDVTDWIEYSSTQTGWDGEYLFSGLPDDTYRIGFSDTWYNLYVTEFWSDRATVLAAHNIPLVGGATVTDVDASLSRQTGTGHGGSITGRVSTAGTDWGLGSATVDLYYWEGDVWYTVASTFTGSDGRYLLTGLAAGQYRISYSDGYGYYESAYYLSQPDLGSATSIPLGEDGDVRAIDQALSLYPSAIAGTVIDQVTHAPIGNVHVNLYRNGGFYTSCQTDDMGRYMFTSLPSGDYKLYYSDNSGLHYAEYWEDASELGSATAITLDGTDVATGIDPELALGGMISGTITADVTGDPIGTGSVAAYRYNEAGDYWEYYAESGTDSSGRYVLSMLPYGTYRVSFADYDHVYLPEYYQDAPGLLDADDITASDTPVTGIDGELSRGGRISGSVTHAGSPVVGAVVYPYVYDAYSGSWSMSSAYARTTDGSGQFTITGLPFGTYRFVASATGYVNEFYQEALTVETATSLVFADDILKTGLNMTLDHSATMSGRVSDLSGIGLSAINVQLYQLRVDFYGDRYWTSVPLAANTGVTGDYTIGGIPPGTYRVRFYDTNVTAPYYLPEYYSEKPNVYDASSLVVTYGDSLTSIGASMTTGASISGRVLDESDSALQGVTVRALAYNPPDDDWEPYGPAAVTDSSGNYALSELPDDAYRIGFAKSGYITQYFEGAGTVFDGDSVTIAGGVSQSGKDVHLVAGTLPPSGSIVGTVTADVTGLGLAEVRVIAFRSDPMSNGGWYWANSTDTQAGGAYSMTAPEGVYRIQFVDNWGRCLNEYYNDTGDRAMADHVTVASGATVVVSADLADAGSISGIVTAEDTGLPVVTASVGIYGRVGSDWYFTRSESVNADGSYTIDGLAAGSYRAYFSDGSGVFRSEYYSDKPSLESAQEILLASAEDRTGIHASLKRYGTITGTVTGDDGRLVDEITVDLYRRYPDSWQWASSTVTGADGTYDIGNLEPGDYIARFSDLGSYGLERYLPEYHTDASRTADATVLSVAYAKVAVNETLASTGTWGDISGTVIDAFSGDPVEGIAICRYDSDGGGGWEYAGYDTETSVDGTYTLQWVPEGTNYRICADPDVAVDGEYPWSGIYALTYHPDAAAIGDAAPVAVTAGVESAGVDIDVAPEATTGYLAGHVIADGTGNDIAATRVELWSAAGGDRQLIAELHTDAAGRFMRPVPAGQYVLYLDHWPAYRQEFYKDVLSSSPYDGTLVEVTAAASAEVTASLEPLGSISGTVTSDNGHHPIADVSVEIYRPDGGSGWAWAASTSTGDDGAYSVVGLSYGVYRIAYSDNSGNYVNEYYTDEDQLETADDVTVASTPTTGVDVGLADGASISGVVTDAATHAGLEGIFVYAYRFDPVYGWQSYGGIYTEAGGVFTIRSLPGDTYRLGFFDWSTDYADEYFNDKRILLDADDVLVPAAADVTGFDAALEKQGSISGTITDVGTSNPIPNPTVYAYRYCASLDDWQIVSGVSGDGNGFYTIANLAPGTYRLDFSKSGYVPETYHNEYSTWSGDDVTVGNGQHVDIDEALSQGTTISGTVRNGAGTGIQSVYVTALRHDQRYGVWTFATGEYTAADGAYTLQNLGDYDYRIAFTDSSEHYLPEYYDDAATPETANPVSVNAGLPVSSVDATLAAWAEPARGTIAGTVRADAGGTRLGGVQVTASRWMPANGQWSGMGDSSTASDGTYSIPLDVGTYRLHFVDPSGAYVSEFHHNGADSYWDGIDVQVTGDTTTTVDEGLATAAHIRGTVTAESGGAALQDVAVNLYEVGVDANWTWVGTDLTSADGTYDLGGMEGGRYLVGFDDTTNVHLDEYYDDATDMGYATQIELAAAEIREGIDAQLATAGIISGMVTNVANDRPVENLHVTLWRDYGYATYTYAHATTDESGRYACENLGPGTYYVQFTDDYTPTGFTRFLTEFYQDAADLDGATPIVVTNQEETADGQLTSTGTWGGISGTIVDGINGTPVGNIPVVLWYDDGGFAPDYDYVAYSNADGTYEFPYVPELPGQDPYRVCADGSYSGSWDLVYDRTWHAAAPTVGSGQDVPLVGNAYLTDIDVNMIRKSGTGWIGGTVRSDATSATLGGIDVDIYSSGLNLYCSTTTQPDGTWGRVVAAHTYRVEFSHGAGAYASEWYDNALTSDSATPVEVLSGGTRTVNASLANAGHITGHVRDSSGAPISTWVLLRDASDDSYVTEIHTDDGLYAFDGLSARAYTVWFSASGPYMGEYWNDHYYSGDPIQLAAGETRAGIDATLTVGGRIHGTIDADDGALSNHVVVSYYSDGPSGWEWVYDQWAYSFDGWTYESTELPPGEYKLEFRDVGDAYAPLWHDAATSLADATIVTLGEAGSVTVNQTLDGLPPEVASDAVTDYDNEASIEITATDLVSGVAGITYDVDGNGPVTEAGSTADVSVTGWGTHYLYYWATDNVGHESDHGERVDFTIADTIAPTAGSDAESTYPGDATITIFAADEADGSGLEAIYYIRDGGVTSHAPSPVLADFHGIGDHSLEFWAVDNAGNESVHETVDFTIADSVDPTADDDAVASYNDTAVIHLTADDNIGVHHISYRVDGGDWVVDSGDAATVTVTDLGSHLLEYQAFDADGNSSPVYSASFSVVRTGDVTVVPIAGNNRYDTAVAVSKEAFPAGSDWVVIATGLNWPDALGGSALAGALEGPILLTDTNTLPSTVRAEIDRLGAEKAIILGAPVAVGTPVETALKSMLGSANVERIAGANRYRTADLVGARAIAELGSEFDGTAFVATGANYPDALAAAPLSAGLHWPLFLTKPTGLEAQTKAAMSGVQDVLILGGTSVVPSAIESGLNTTYGSAHVDRLAGANRYATAVEVAKYGVAHGLSWDRLAITTGEKFPDALAGGVLQGRDGSVMLLTRSTVLDSNVASVLNTNKAKIGEVRFLGGLPAISQAVRNSVVAILE